MAKFIETCPAQGLLITTFLADQIQPGTFEHTLTQLLDGELDLSFFDERYRNDETGAPAYDPRILLKVIIFAYSRGITSSRRIAQCCKENLVFMALSHNTSPHFTTIANFVSSMDKEALDLFHRVLLYSDEMGLIGKEMFAIDGCKLPSNASKQWSGTRKDFKKKSAKMEKAIRKMVTRHRENDNSQADESFTKRAEKSISTLRRKKAKIDRWLEENDDKIGKTGKPVKSNITDNDSAKMTTSKGVIQGYNGVATVDEKHQIIVHAEAFGQGNEQDLLKPMIDGTRENFQAIEEEQKDIFDKTKLSADSGFHSEKNMEMVFSEEIDAYIADNQFRKRDPRFADYGRYKERHRKERSRPQCRKGLFKVDDFIFPKDLSHCICPAGKRLYRNGGNVVTENHLAVRFKGPKSSCGPCHLRSKCLRNPERTEARQVAYFLGRTEQGKTTFTEKMKRKIDSTVGRALYSMRLAIAEPPFANICHMMGLKRFSLRGRKKVNNQWQLFCTLHNMKKIHGYAEVFA